MSTHFEGMPFFEITQSTIDVGKKHREFLAIITTPVNISVAMRSYLCVCMFPLVRVRLINDDRQPKETNGQ